MPTRIFKDGNQFLNKFNDYVKHCEEKERLANIAGFAVYCKMNRDSFYQQKEYYPQEYNMINDILEDYTLNANLYPTLKIFYLKCKFKYNDHNGDNLQPTNRVTIVDDLPGDDDE